MVFKRAQLLKSNEIANIVSYSILGKLINLMHLSSSNYQTKIIPSTQTFVRIIEINTCKASVSYLTRGERAVIQLPFSLLVSCLVSSALLTKIVFVTLMPMDPEFP